MIEIQNNSKGIIGIAGGILAVIGSVIFGVTKVVPTELPILHAIVISGHGGEDNGVYQTAGKQSPRWPDGIKIYEGIQNRLFGYMLCASLIDANIEVTFINGYNFDLSLQERALRVNAEYDRLKAINPDMHIIAVSLHSNAQIPTNADYTDNEGQRGYTSAAAGGAIGIETYTTKGWTASDNFNENYLMPKLMSKLPEFTFRRGFKQKGKEANFYILRATKCPIVLIEFGFMTTWTDCVLTRKIHK